MSDRLLVRLTRGLGRSLKGSIKLSLGCFCIPSLKQISAPKGTSKCTLVSRLRHTTCTRIFKKHLDASALHEWPAANGKSAAGPPDEITQAWFDLATHLYKVFRGRKVTVIVRRVISLDIEILVPHYMFMLQPVNRREFLSAIIAAVLLTLLPGATLCAAQFRGQIRKAMIVAGVTEEALVPLKAAGFEGWATIKDHGLEPAEFKRRFELIAEGK